MADIDRGKVIEILSRHKTMTFGDKPYDGIRFDLGDVVALLKEQDAKCLTKEELSGLQEQQFVWLEGKSGLLYCLRIIGICAGNDGVTDIQYDTPESYIEQSTEKYGINFRLWTAQPTDEQRQDVKWE